MLTLEIMQKMWPHGNAKVPGLIEGIARTAQFVFPKYGISSDLVVAHVMAQVSHECGAGNEVVENLNYTAIRMTQVWPSRFPSVSFAAPFANNPKALADKVYNGRMGNAVGTDDGWNFRGRGATQTTGREGYTKLAQKTGLDLLGNPDLLNDPEHFLECGVADFILCGCLPYAVQDDVFNVTKHLNGGIIGLEERKTWLLKWKAVLANSPQIKPIPAKPPTTEPPVVVTSPAIPVPTPEPAQPIQVPTPPTAPAPKEETQGYVSRFISAVLSAFRSKK